MAMCSSSTVNHGQEEPYVLGTGYNHMAVAVDDIESALADLAPLGVEPEKPPYHPGGREELPLIAFVADPDGYRIELDRRRRLRTRRRRPARLAGLDLRAGDDVVPRRRASAPRPCGRRRSRRRTGRASPARRSRCTAPRPPGRGRATRARRVALRLVRHRRGLGVARVDLGLGRQRQQRVHDRARMSSNVVWPGARTPPTEPLNSVSPVKTCPSTTNDSMPAV